MSDDHCAAGVSGTWTLTVLTERAAQHRAGSLGRLPPAVALTPGRPAAVGRESEVRLGAEPLDTRLSRRALLVDVDQDQWSLQVLNGKGAHIHPWRARSFPVGGTPEAAGHVETIRAARVGVRLHGSPDLVHWVLLESRAGPSAPVADADRARAGEPTEKVDLPNPLTIRQLEALRQVFEPQLAWPPSLEPPLLLKQAAARMGIGERALQARLEEVREKAVALGMPPTVSPTDVTCLYQLAAADYLDR
ncbi:MAG: hypothetical protein JNM77_13000 [Pseudonocardia sp.]|nr:hypothetical protein [Pseudonocardia sp.]